MLGTPAAVPPPALTSPAGSFSAPRPGALCVCSEAPPPPPLGTVRKCGAEGSATRLPACAGGPRPPPRLGASRSSGAPPPLGQPVPGGQPPLLGVRRRGCRSGWAAAAPPRDVRSPARAAAAQWPVLGGEGGWRRRERPLPRVSECGAGAASARARPPPAPSSDPAFAGGSSELLPAGIAGRSSQTGREGLQRDPPEGRQCPASLCSPPPPAAQPTTSGLREGPQKPAGRATERLTPPPPQELGVSSTAPS